MIFGDKIEKWRQEGETVRQRVFDEYEKAKAKEKLNANRSKMVSNGYSKKCLTKTRNGTTIYLFKSWDLTHGKGYFCVAFYKEYRLEGFGFHRSNKFTAYREALKFEGYLI